METSRFGGHLWDALFLVALALNLVADWPSFRDGDWGALAPTLTGLAFVVAGQMARYRRPDSNVGPLLLLSASLWPLGSLYKWPGSLTAILGNTTGLLFWLWIPPLVYLVLSFPNERIERRRDRFVFWFSLVPTVVMPLVLAPLRDLTLGCPDCRENPLLVSSQPELIAAAVPVTLVISIVLIGMIVARVAAKWRRATTPGRRQLVPVAVTAALSLAATLVAVLLVEYIPVARENSRSVFRVAWAFVGIVPFGFLSGLLRARARRARVGELMVELGELPTPERFQQALRDALGDPSLTAAFWVPEAKRYLTAEGSPLQLPSEGGPVVPTFLERQGQPLAVILHDRSLLDDPGLVAAATAAARLAVENERLQEEVLSQLGEVRASRLRIIQAGDDARKKLERDLHDGAQQRLVTLTMRLQILDSKLGPMDDEAQEAMTDAKVEVKAALTELRDLARGLHPMVLTEEGLGPAIKLLAERSPVPVSLAELVDERLLAPVEIAAYFVVSEALANIAKHAHATSVSISAKLRDEILEVTITDDGIGGASILTGSGLRGLADRVHALEGTITVTSPAGEGTTITARFPADRDPGDAQEISATTQVRDLLASIPDEHETTASLLQCRSLDIFHGARQVLFGVDIDVAAGEVVAVMGTNGAGKSTLVRTIAGLHDPLRGSIRFDGEDLSDMPAEVRMRSGIVFIQGGATVFEPLTVDENLRLFARNSGVSPKDALDRAFHAFPTLAAKKDQRAGSLSRGEKHMVGLARAVVADARLVIIDELSLGLSPAAVDEVCGHVRELNESGATILFVEQSTDVASAVAQRAIFMDSGRVVFDGEISDLHGSGKLAPAWFATHGLADA